MLRTTLGIIYLVIIGGMLHEVGHLGIARLQGLNVLEYQIMGLNPHVRVEVGTVLFFLGGILTIPLYLILHRLIFNGIYDYEVMYIIVGSLLGSSSDIYKILLVLKII